MQRLFFFVSLAWLLALPFHEQAARVGLGICLGLWGLLHASRQTPWVGSPLDRPLLWFLGAGFLSAAFSTAPALALPTALGSWGLLAFFVGKEIATSEARVQRLLRVLLLVALAGAALDLLARFSAVAGGLQRTAGPDQAGLQVLLLVLFSAVTVCTGKRWGLLLTVPLAVSLLALPFSAAHITALGCSTLLPALAPRHWRLAAVMVVTMLVVVLAAVALTPTVPESTGGVETVGRPEAWRDATEALRQAPLLGLGPDRFPHDARSNLFRQAVEGGMLGLSLFLLIWVSFYGAVLPRAWKLLRQRDPRSAVLWSILLAVTSVHVLGLVEVTLGGGILSLVTLLLAGIPFGLAFQAGEAT